MSRLPIYWHRTRSALALPLDVTSTVMIEEAVQKAEVRFGRIDVLYDRVNLISFDKLTSFLRANLN